MSVGRKVVLEQDASTPEEVAGLLRRLSRDGFFGTLLLTLRDGAVVNAQKSQSLAPRDVRREGEKP